MISSQYDVVVVGAGAAGLTAAIGLTRAGFRVAAVEAADFPGAENWSGCVFFGENLARDDILGPKGLDELAWERRLVERGFFGTDGCGLLGMTYRDPAAFRHCYTVLRPIYDHHLAQVALKHGVALLNETTAESLIRDEGRIIGVCTNRGPLYADLVFLAEGDASHLVTREGYERSYDPREAPKFLQGIKQVIDLPPGAIEEIFHVGPDEGVAYELLVRNGSLRGKSIHLNMGGFVYTNKQSLSVGLVLPVANLAEHFAGDPNLLIEWFEGLPALTPWLREGKRGVFGAKLIRGGGAKDIPHLIDDGLAIGGAASAIGVDFPYPNFTGPATAMGCLLVQAACRIRDETGGAPGSFTRDRLQRHYLAPLKRTHYWSDVEFLRRWPGYIKKTRVFFDRNLDVALGTAHIWTRPGRWFLAKWFAWLGLLWQEARPRHWSELRHDLRHLIRALRLREVTDRPSLGRLLLDGTVNALRDLFGKPRANLPWAGTLAVRYSVCREEKSLASPPGPVRRWFRRFGPVLACMARRVYANDDSPLADKLPGALRLFIKQVNLLDLLAAAGLAFFAAVSTVLMLTWNRFRRSLTGQASTNRAGIRAEYARAVAAAVDLTASANSAASQWESRLAPISYHTVKESHIHLHWPTALPDKDAVVQEGLWHVCPAHVYEARAGQDGAPQVVVNFENCIKCETCWRATGLVDWGRDGQHRLIYSVSSPARQRLLPAVQAAGLARPALPLVVDPWEAAARELSDRLTAHAPGARNGEGVALVHDLRRLAAKLERKLQEFDDALAQEPRTVDRARADFLVMLAGYAQRLAERIVEELQQSHWAESPQECVAFAHQQLLKLAQALLAKLEERSRRTWDQHFAWAAADGRQVRYHHLAGLQRLLGTLAQFVTGPLLASDRTRDWLRAEELVEVVASRHADWSTRLDSVFGPLLWRELEKGEEPPGLDAALRALTAEVPRIDPEELADTLHPPLRKALLAELGRRDPSVAYRVACHLWARDLAPKEWVEPWASGQEWACFATVDAVETASSGYSGKAPFIPALGANSLLLCLGNQLAVVPVKYPGLRIEPLATLGLRGAGLATIRLTDFKLPDSARTVDAADLERHWTVLSAADLTAIAAGMAEQLCRRALDHAATRVQFPGLFHDEEARDAIGKFGAVKKMLAEMVARRYLIDTINWNLSPADFSEFWQTRTGLMKAVAAEALGTAPGSLSYNAGQVFGGTGYSEDDILSKFYRDAAAWRFLGPANGDVYRSRQPDFSLIPEEETLFETLVQRKALLAELDQVRRVRLRLEDIAADWRRPANGHAAWENAEFAEGLARHESLWLASKALLLRTHARLEEGHPSEAEIPLLRVWLDHVATSLADFESRTRRRLDPPGRRGARPIVEPTAGPPVTKYADFLAAPCPYNSGDFLSTPIDLLQPRLVPELLESDPQLAEYKHTVQNLMNEYFGGPRRLADGSEVSCYERYVERQHRPDQADLDFCRRHGFFRMPIPKDLGGEGRSKLDYYLVTTTAQRLVDVSVSLTIQGNTSIGTTPVLLARDKDLPRAIKDLDAFLEEAKLPAEIRKEIEDLLASTAEPAARARANDAPLLALRARLQSLQTRLDSSVFSRTATKVLFHRFADCWHNATSAAREYQSSSLREHLQHALAAWTDACAQAAEYRQELERRRQACDLFLRWVAAGHISAFALTEPSAGSDTARVATRARLRSVPVEPEADGIYRFLPIGGKEPRRLLDARRLEFRGEDVFYRPTPTSDPAPIRFDDYDYETDDPARLRYVDFPGRRVPFTDIAQLRERDGKLWYDYWELTGAKMWITNARMAGVMCLYAKTEEGVTGFMVDRHADGLIVGKDEAKMGQCGSPTNELSLQAVRIPRENVLGLEGRGQVNALETLNVGRAGLAMSAMAQMEGIFESCRRFATTPHPALTTHHSLPWQLECMEEVRFIAEALAYDVIGRFEHAQTKSARMESAISKMLVSELLHEIIEHAEEIFGLAGQTQEHLLEKRKRDARILNIYEGTNEIQRFFILKDLMADVAPRWAKPAPMPHVGREALELEALKAKVRRRIDAAIAAFGQQIWRNPNLQASSFVLAELAAWIKAADSTLGRLAWLSRQASPEESTDASPRIELGQRALARCTAEIRNRLHRFDEELAHLRRGYYAPAIRAASLLLGAQHKLPAASTPASRITRPLSVLVIVEPGPYQAPQPQVADGKLLEPHLCLNDADRSALETALRLRDDAAAPVVIEVAAVAAKGAGQALRQALSLGAHRVRLLAVDGDTVPPDLAAGTLASSLSGKYDLVLSGYGGAGEEEGLLARLTAAALDVPFAGMAAHAAVQASPSDAAVLLSDADGSHKRAHALPAAVLLAHALPLRKYPVSGYLAALPKAIDVQRWPKKASGRSVTCLAAAAAAPHGEALPGPLTPQQAASQILTAAGLAGAAAAMTHYAGAIDDVPHPEALEAVGEAGGRIVAVVAAAADGTLHPTAVGAIQAACRAAEIYQTVPAVLLLVSANEDAQRRALGQLFANYSGDVVLLVAQVGGPSADVAARLLRESWPQLRIPPRAVIGEPWTESAFVVLARRLGKPSPRLLHVRRLYERNGALTAETSRLHGKVRLQQVVDAAEGTAWISLASEVDIDATPAIRQRPPRVQRWSPRLDRLFGQADMQQLLEEVKQESGLPRLADADFIIDVGCGVGNRDGYEAVIEPLERALRQAGVKNVVVGGSRKVTEELHLLPADRQIGQSGVSVNPQVLLAIGVSGAPQHLNYIGPRATIIAFNRDPEAPLMTLNQRRPRPRVFPVLGDLFETVPALIAALHHQVSVPEAELRPLAP